MKRKQITAILLSAIMTVSTCVSAGGISALAAETADTGATQAAEVEEASAEEIAEEPEQAEPASGIAAEEVQEAVDEELSVSEETVEDDAADDDAIEEEAAEDETEAGEAAKDETEADDAAEDEVTEEESASEIEAEGKTESSDNTELIDEAEDAAEEQATDDEPAEEEVLEAEAPSEAMMDGQTDIIASGTCGDLNWTLYGDGTMTFSGAGEMTEPRWWSYLDKITNIILSEGVTSITSHAFNECPNLLSVTIPSSVTFIDYGAFASCSNLVNVTISEGVSEIGQEAFYGCGFESLTIPSSVQFIDINAFTDCKNLKTITIPEGITSLGFGVFENCTNLKEITIPKSVTNIDNKAFNGCTSLGDVYYKGSKSEWDAVTIGKNNDPLLNANIHFGQNLENATISGLADKTYTGSAITQAPVVTYAGTVLTAGKDYKVGYSNNVNAGTATVTITGIGDYSGTKTATFAIGKAAQPITASAAASTVAVGRKTTVSAAGTKGIVSFATSNPEIATVDSTGKITAKAVGTVTITATAAATANYNTVSKAVTIKILPAATMTFKAANVTGKGIKLTWVKTAGANGYIIYRNNKKIKTISSGSTITFTDTTANTNGSKYTYKIYAKASTGTSPLYKSVIIYKISRPAVKSLSNSAAKKMTVNWAKNAKAKGYQIQYSLKSNFGGAKTAKITKKTTVSKVIGNLTKGKTYYVRIRTYKTASGKTYYSAWSASKKVKISK